MPTTSFSVTTPAANAANATGYVQADGFASPVQLGAPLASTTGVHSNGPARLPFGQILGVVTGLTAHSGGGQTNALLLTAPFNIVTTVAAANDSVKLPPATAANVGQQVWVQNAAATNSMQVYGSGTDTINAVATATGVAVAAGKTGLFTVQAAGKWVGLLALA